MHLVPFSTHKDILIPHDWQEVGAVLCIPGSVPSGYVGLGALCLTPDALVLSTTNGVEEIVPLWGIEDVSVVKFDGVLIERNTSVGVLLSPLPYPHGIETVYTLETRLRLRLRIVTMFANHAHEWANDIRRAARTAQMDSLPNLKISRRSID